MDTPHTPQVQIPGEPPASTQPRSAIATAPPPANHISTSVEMGGTQDATLPDAHELELELAQPEPEPRMKKNAGSNFLE